MCGCSGNGIQHRKLLCHEKGDLFQGLSHQHDHKVKAAGHKIDAVNLWILIYSAGNSVEALAPLGNDLNFDKSGNRYELKEGNEYKQKYINMLNVGYGYDAENPNRVEVAFNVNAADVSVEQAFKVTSKYDSTYNEERTLEVSALSSFKNVGNTIANVKDEDVKSVYDVLGGALEPVIYDMLMGDSDEGGND